jgi:hypothetical protein
MTENRTPYPVRVDVALDHRHPPPPWDEPCAASVCPPAGGGAVTAAGILRKAPT